MARILGAFGDNIDTDQNPFLAAYAPYMTSDGRSGQVSFIEHRPEFRSASAGGDIIVAGTNFGCGSSRDMRRERWRAVGIAAIICAQLCAHLLTAIALQPGPAAFLAEFITQGTGADGAEAVLES